MKKIIKLTLVLAMAFSTTTLYAQKLARVNKSEIFAVMPETKEMQTNLEAFGKDLNDQLEQIQVEFNNRYAEFQKNQATMAESIKQMKAQELEQLQQRYTEFQRIAQEDFQKKQGELAHELGKRYACSRAGWKNPAAAMQSDHPPRPCVQTLVGQ